MEGQKVRYVGEDVTVGVGTVGRVVAAAGSGQHVQWMEGARQGSIDLVAVDDLVPYVANSEIYREATVANDFDDALGVPSMVSFSVRETYDTYGEDGLLNALDEHGHLATLAEYATDAIGKIASGLRSDPAFSSVLSQLDDSEAESLLVRVAINLLSDDEEG